MHPEIFSEEQQKLLPLAQKFYKDFGLVGGTAIALQLGHRRSIDFDMFTLKDFDNLKIRTIIVKSGRKVGKVYKDERGQFTFFVNDVQFTFFQYPFKIDYSENYKSFLKFPSLLTLAAMKAFALGRRAKWKDYVDLYFVLQAHHSIQEIVKTAKHIFGNEFNERIFRGQLSFFRDIDYTEAVEFMLGFEVSNKKIEKALVEFSLS